MQTCPSAIDHKHTTENQSAPQVIVMGGTSGIDLALALHHSAIGWQVRVVGHNDAKITKINSLTGLKSG
jgi:short-subunit dehydrogenase involved in D-alanine esterification of teichoic acids